MTLRDIEWKRLDETVPGENALYTEIELKTQIGGLDVVIGVHFAKPMSLADFGGKLPSMSLSAADGSKAVVHA